MLIIFPPDDLLAQFDTLISPVYNLHFSNEIEANSLANIRDTLIPKLLSGEVFSKDTIQILGEAA
jgi:type I restriction enzyme S subunit